MAKQEHHQAAEMSIKQDVFMAAKDGNLSNLKVFLDHMTQEEVSTLVSAKTSNGSTPLVVSCWHGHKEVVEFLVDKCCASIEQTGTITIIMGKAGSITMRQDSIGNIVEAPPLWCAAAAGHLDIVEMLVKSGARIDVDAYRMTPLLVACVKPHLHIINYFINEKKELLTKKERIDAFELLGATCINKKQDIPGALELWKTAMKERYEDGILVIPKLINKSPISAYNNMLEVETMMELEQIISEPDTLQMQALMVRERILGPANPITSFWIMYRGSMIAKTGHFNRAITLWMYALEMQETFSISLSIMVDTFLGFARLFSLMMSHGGYPREKMFANMTLQRSQSTLAVLEKSLNEISNTLPMRVKFIDIMMVFRRMIKVLGEGHFALLDAGDLRNRDRNSIDNIIAILVHLVCLLTKQIPHLEKEKVSEVKKAVSQFVTAGFKVKEGSTPLHIACCRNISGFLDTRCTSFQICSLPSLPTINLLLECGAPVNARNDDGNTALHIAARKPVDAEVIQSLLQNGAHYDMVNNEKKTFYDLLQGTPLHEITNLAAHSRLACLAARVVRKHDLELDSLPLTLKDFVLKH